MGDNVQKSDQVDINLPQIVVAEEIGEQPRRGQGDRVKWWCF